jgi:hypothetical protein
VYQSARFYQFMSPVNVGSVIIGFMVAAGLFALYEGIAFVVARALSGGVAGAVATEADGSRPSA